MLGKNLHVSLQRWGAFETGTYLMDAEGKPETLFFQFESLVAVQNETGGRLLMEL